MLNKLKIIGLTAIAALAVSAVAATAAQANPQFHVEEAPATITGSQIGNQVFSTNSGTVSCTTASFHGNSSVLTTTTQTLEASYSGCTAFGFIGATVHMNGCDYLFHLTSDTVAPYDATVDVVCSGSNVIEITAGSGCTTTVGPQTGLTGVSISNAGSKSTRDLTVKLAIEGIKYTNHGCFSSGTFNTGKLSGEATVKADKSSGAQQGLWVA